MSVDPTDDRLERIERMARGWIELGKQQQAEADKLDAADVLSLAAIRKRTAGEVHGVCGEDILGVIDDESKFMGNTDAVTPAPFDVHEGGTPDDDRESLIVLLQEWYQGLSANTRDAVGVYDMGALYTLVSAWANNNAVSIQEMRQSLDRFGLQLDDEED